MPRRRYNEDRIIQNTREFDPQRGSFEPLVADHTTVYGGIHGGLNYIDAKGKRTPKYLRKHRKSDESSAKTGKSKKMLKRYNRAAEKRAALLPDGDGYTKPGSLKLKG